MKRQSQLGELAARPDSLDKQIGRESKRYAAVRANESEADRLHKALLAKYPSLTVLGDILFWEVRIRPCGHEAKQILRGVHLLLVGQWASGKYLIDAACGTLLPEEPLDKPTGRIRRENLAVEYRPTAYAPAPFDIEKDPIATIGTAYQKGK